jgi:hypothetical protein
MSTTFRFILSILAVIVYRALYYYISYATAISTSNQAVTQFSDNDVSSQLTFMSLTAHLPFVLFIAFLATLLWIWWGKISAVFKGTGAKALVVASLATLLLINNGKAYAYYAQSDYAEWVNIGPNETAFFIPVEGANKSSQAQFDSADFLDKRKVAAKRIQIPHIQQANTSVIRNYYVPSAIVVKLDRSFISRTFKGNDPNDPCGKNSQCFSFESQEGVTMHVGVAVTAWIPEEKAATYLYRHGVVKPTQDAQGHPMSPDAITYASVFEARPLSGVMETNIHNEIQALLSQEFGRYPFKDAVAKKVDIMNAVRTSIKQQFSDAGIEITSIGFATPLVFPTTISIAINSVIAAQHDAEALAATRTVMDVKAQQADIAVKYAIASAIEHDKLPKLPTFMVLPESVFKWFSDTFAGWFGSNDNKPKK